MSCEMRASYSPLSLLMTVGVSIEPGAALQESLSHVGATASRRVRFPSHPSPIRWVIIEPRISW